MEQLTKEQAIAVYESGQWGEWSDEEIVKFQLYQRRLCVPFSSFHKAIEAVLGRPVWTHEFADGQWLIDEYEGKHPKPTFEDIVNLIPKDKLTVFIYDDKRKEQSDG